MTRTDLLWLEFLGFALIVAITLVDGIMEAWRDPETKRDIERLREHRRIRKASRR